MRKSILYILLGAIIGCGSALMTRKTPSTNTLNTPPTSGPVALPGWDWRQSPTPGALNETQAASAIQAWLASLSTGENLNDFAARADSLQTLLAHLSTSDYPGLLAPLLSHSTDLAPRLCQLAFTSWIERDPFAAAIWIIQQSSVPGIDTLELARQAGREWAQRDPLAAARWACSLTPKAQAETLARDILPILAKTDAQKALSLAQSLGQEFVDTVIPSLVDVLAQDNPGLAMTTFGALAWNDGKALWTLRDPISRWIRQDPQAAIDWLASMPLSEPRYLANALINYIRDPQIAHQLADAILNQPAFPARQKALSQVFWAWFGQAETDSMAWLQAIPDKHLQNEMIIAADRHFSMEHSADNKMALLLARPRSWDRIQQIELNLTQWAESDPSAALTWVGNHPDPDVDRAMLKVNGAMLGKIASDEPQTALTEWQKLPSDEAKKMAMESIAEGWAKSDPGAALKWLSEQRATYNIPNDYYDETLVFAWSKKSPEDALHWAETINDEKARAYALNSIAGTWNEKADRSTTADLYTQISDTNLRIETLTTHIKEWLTKDPDGARQWVQENNSLSASQKAAILAGNTTP